MGPGKIAVYEESGMPTDTRERFDPPEGTRLLIEPLGERGVRMTHPPLGYSSGGFKFCMVVAGLFFASAFGLGTVLGSGMNHPNGRAVAVTIGVVGGLVFSVIPLIMAMSVATDGFVLIATPDSLSLKTTSLGGTYSKAWKTSEITWIRAETEVVFDEGTSFVTRVRIGTTPSQTFKAKDLGLLNLEKSEMERIATTLREALGVPAGDETRQE